MLYYKDRQKPKYSVRLRNIMTEWVNAERRDKMEEMFSSIMAGFMKGMSEDDKKRMVACGEKMAGMCSCLNRKDMSKEEKKAMMEKMMSFCDSKMETMSAFFKKMGLQPEQKDTSENK